jgi:hypothetical protein
MLALLIFRLGIFLIHEPDPLQFNFVNGTMSDSSSFCFQLAFDSFRENFHTVAGGRPFSLNRAVRVNAFCEKQKPFLGQQRQKRDRVNCRKVMGPGGLTISVVDAKILWPDA